ncbi:PaaI family thioesterase [Dyadobacter sp. 676]|uniref:PaaI family thioesterase n=1 Tax=Dyadobacter sp. 676 TaxID=3088362 RepID=A0AAU8FVU1_9BACT
MRLRNTHHDAENAEVLAVEFNVNFLRPANTDKLLAIGKVLKSGKTLTVGEGYVYDSDQNILIAKMTATMISVY